MRSMVSQIDSYRAASNTFRNKYNCLPGDCAKAVELGLGTSGGDGDTGNGDNMILGFDGSNYNNDWFNDEMGNYWYHLSQAKLMNGNFVSSNGINMTDLIPDNSLPSVKYGIGGKIVVGWSLPEGFTEPLLNHNVFWIFKPAKYIRMVAGGTGPADECQSSSNYCDFTFTPLQAHSYDTKVDDGLPNTGNVQAAYKADMGIPDTISCVTAYPSSTATYRLTTTTLSCALMVRAD